jgi:nucleoside-diphosphate-sugar epimerase
VKNKKVLVTGGAGYIGTTLVPKLLDLGYTVTVVDNLMYRQTVLTTHCSNPNFKFVRADVRDNNVMDALIKTHDIIIPLACLVGMPACKKDERAAVQINQDAVQHIADIAGKNKKIIFPTTNSGYGVGQMKNGELVFCNEETPLAPLSLYGTTKVNAENYLKDKSGAVCLRLATVFGISERMRLDLLVNDFTYRACTDKFIVLFESHFKRNFIHVKDVVGAILFSIDNYEQMSGQSYNVGLSSANLSKLELCNKIKNLIVNFAIQESQIDNDPDKRNYIVSNEKLESLGWKPQVSLEEGIKELVHAYQIISYNNKLFTNQ